MQKKKLKDSQLGDLGIINCLLACMSSSPLALFELLLDEADERADKIFTIQTGTVGSALAGSTEAPCSAGGQDSVRIKRASGSRKPGLTVP